MKRFLAALVVLIGLFSFSQAEELTVQNPHSAGNTVFSEAGADETLIVATASVSVNAPADTAVLSFAIEAEGETVAQANQQVTANAAAVCELLAGLNVEQSQIWKNEYDIEPNVIYHNTRFTEDRVIEGYQATIVLCVRLTDVSLIGAAIDTAAQSGAAVLRELTLECSGAQGAYEEALAQAVQLAMHKAQVLASGCGMELAGLAGVEELSLPDDGEAAVQVTYRAR